MRHRENGNVARQLEKARPASPAGRDQAVAVTVIPALDGLRGYCALLVTALHCWYFAGMPRLDDGPIRALVSVGGLGVDYFFVLSGFCLSLPIARNDGVFGSVRSYAIRRVARITPAYYTSLAVLVLCYPLLAPGPGPLSSGAGLASVAAHLAYLHYLVPAWLLRNTAASSGVGFGVNGALWSLSIEACFYVALPLVAGTYFRRPFVSLVVALAAALGWRTLAFQLPPLATLVGVDVATNPGPPRLFTQFPGYLAHFAFGMTGAWVCVRLGRAVRARGAGLGAVVVQVAALVALLGSMIAASRFYSASGAPTWSSRYLVDIGPAFAFAVLMTATALAPPWACWPFANRLARWLGDVSYGVYLWHSMLIHFFMRTVGIVPDSQNRTFALLGGLVLGSALLCGWLSHRFIEAPVIAYARVRTARRPGA
jgi:peptidoglycan/LPS O-acetylase OafA/YrhL